MNQSHHLLFELTEASVDEWLLTFERLPITESINRLSQVLNTVTRLQVDHLTLFRVLRQLTETVFLLSKTQEQYAQKVNDSPEKAGKWMIAAQQRPKRLAFAFASQKQKFAGIVKTSADMRWRTF